MKALRIAGIVIVVLIAVVLLAVAFVVPPIARKQAVAKVKELTGREFAIRDVAINPFTLTVKISGVEMKEPDGKTTFVSFSSAKVSASIASVWHLAPVLDDAELHSPYVRVVRVDKNKYNFSDIQERLAKQPKEPKKGKTEFSVNNISVTHGSVDFHDKALPKETDHTVRQMEVRIPFISNMGYLSDKYVKPSFGALVNGSPLMIDGKLKPFKDSVEASVEVRLKEVDVPFYQAYFPADTPVSVDSGFVTVDGLVAYTAHKNAKPDLSIRGFLGLKKVLLRDSMHQPIFALKSAALYGRDLNIMGNKYEADYLDTDGMEVWLARDSRGVWSHTRLAAKKKPSAEEAPKAAQKEKEKTEAKTPIVRVNVAGFRNGLLHFRDDMTGFHDDIHDILLQVGGFNLQNENTAVRLSMQAAYGDRVTAAALVSLLDPVEVGAHVDVSGVKLQTYYPFLKPYLARPVKGTAELSGDVYWDPKNGARADHIGLALRDAAADFGGGDYARLGLLRVTDVEYLQKQSRLGIKTVLFDRGNFRVTREKGGKISAMNILRAKKKGASIEKPTKKKKGEEPVFRYRIDDIALKRFNMDFKDASVEKPVNFRLRHTDADLKRVTGPKFVTMPFRINTGYAENGSIRANGTILPEPLKLRIAADLRRVPLKDFNSYFPKTVNVVVADGKLDADVKANVAKKGKETVGSFAGNVDVRRFQAQDGTKHQDLLVWQSLDLEKMKGDISPFKLDIDKVALNEYYANIVINKDGTINLQNALQPPGAQEQKKEEKKGPPPQIKVRVVTLENGSLAFEDDHLEPQKYSTRFVNLGGRISGLDSTPGQTAGVDLRGALENHSPLRISGELNPLSPEPYYNIKVSFEDIELPRLTPFSGTYLGYAINQGKLSLDLKYRVENKQINAENKVFIDQLTFGRKVPSKQATNLPVPLAVSLLKDRKGEINLDVPVTGRTDDPKFHLWDAIKTTVKNLFVKMTTSPFEHLGSLFKGKYDFRSVYFDYGSHTLRPDEKEKLQKLGEALEQRPGLDIDVMGLVDRERDAEGYRNYLVTERMRMEKYIETVKGPQHVPQGGHIPDNIRIEPSEYSKYLKIVYRKADFPKPRDAFGRVKDLPDEEMKKLILAHTQVGDAELRELSRQRSLAVRDYLAAEGKVPQERTFLKMGDIYKEPDHEVPTKARVDFGVATKKTRESE